jgi:pimeloyl-ACP methyl ester carboxylesterase
MPRLSRPDGVEIHYEERGEGPLVVMTSYWSMHPSALEPIIDELSHDHRVVRYDDRGLGESTRRGPYDLDTSAADLAALLQHLGEPAVLLGVADGPARAVRVARDHPDLVAALVCMGGPPFGRAAFKGSDALVTSEPVVEALLSQVETDYRGVLRALLTATNAQMTEDELRERVASQAEYSPGEAAAPRLREWANDDAFDAAVAMGDRIWVIVSEALSGGWFPAGAEMAAVVEKMLPEAHVEEVDDGWVSRPDQTAAVVRKAGAAARRPVGEVRA